MSWNIIFYETSTRKPVEDFIDSLQTETAVKMTREIELLKKYGIHLGMPNAKPIGRGLYELRVRGKQEVRCIYVFVIEGHINVLHGFIKKTRAISTKDLAIARVRQKEVERYYSNSKSR
jgi:phage-related protein